MKKYFAIAAMAALALVSCNKNGFETARSLVFIIGGPYGFADSVYERSDAKLSLSKMTFSHQMIRLLFVEQIYRACTIIKGEPYHHE